MRKQSKLLRTEEKLPFTLFRQIEAGALSRGKVVQGRVGADKVVEKEEHGNEVVGRSKRRKALLGFVQALNCLLKHSMRLLVKYRRGSSRRGCAEPHAVS